MQMANLNHEGIRIRIIVEKETNDLSETIPMDKEEIKSALREVGSYLWSRADFKTLVRIKNGG